MSITESIFNRKPKTEMDFQGKKIIFFLISLAFTWIIWSAICVCIVILEKGWHNKSVEVVCIFGSHSAEKCWVLSLMWKGLSSITYFNITPAHSKSSMLASSYFHRIIHAATLHKLYRNDLPLSTHTPDILLSK